MRRAMVLLIAVAVMLGIPIVVGATTPDDYVGSWVAEDNDGSSMTMRIWRAGPKLQMRLFDDGGHGCDSSVWDPGPPVVVPTIDLDAKGKGTLNGVGDAVFDFTSSATTVSEGAAPD